LVGREENSRIYRRDAEGAESGRVEEWKSGRVEEWKSGRVEEWKSGRVEEWKSGRVEEWKRTQEHRQECLCHWKARVPVPLEGRSACAAALKVADWTCLYAGTMARAGEWRKKWRERGRDLCVATRASVPFAGSRRRE